MLSAYLYRTRKSLLKRPLKFVLLLLALAMSVFMIFFPTLMAGDEDAVVRNPNVVLGGISAYFEQEFTGIVIQAVLGTFAALFSVLALYASRVIKVTEKLKATIIVATISIGVLYLAELILALFHIKLKLFFYKKHCY